METARAHGRLKSGRSPPRDHMMNDALHSPTALKLHAFGVGRLHDPNWTGCDLFDELKQYLRGRREPKELLRKPLVDGLSYHLGRWCFEGYLLDELRFDERVDEYGIWFLEDLADLLRFHELQPASEIARLEDLLQRLASRYERSEDEYYRYLDSKKGRIVIADAYSRARRHFHPKIAQLEHVYATDFAERVLHDRQLCAHISRVVVLIGFDGDDDDSGNPRRWCARLRPPRWVVQVLQARDRGKCAQCQTDIVNELSRAPHIDHIVPLRQGGCNDIVNLQLLCDDCNLRKSSRSHDVLSCVPPYLRSARSRSRGRANSGLQLTKPSLRSGLRS